MGSSSGEFPPLAALPQLTLHPSVDPEHLDAAKVANDWLLSFSKSLSRGDTGNLRSHFLEEMSWWRDFVSFSWDLACHNGAEAICKYLASSTTGFAEPKTDQQPGATAALQPQLMDMGGLRFIQSGFDFKTNFGVGRGVLRLANVGPDQWKAWTVFTVLERLNGQDELELQRAKEAAVQSSVSSRLPSSIQTNDGTGLQVLVVGAGQSGLAFAAHLQNLGLKYLVVDKASRPGDSWRARYSTIKSHTPIYTDHYPFLKYPSNWPRYLDQEHIVKWMEHYGDIMGLNIKHDTLASEIEYNESTQRYSVKLQSKDGSMQIINPKHVVLATGPFGDRPIRPTFPGEGSFKGQIYHTSAHKSAALVPDVQRKRVTIIGAGTSAHDVAQDFANCGAEAVTMVQRGPIYVTSLHSVNEVRMKLWNTPGLDTEDADLLGNSLPMPIVRTLGVGASQMMSAMDKDMLDRLEQAGLAVKRGNEGDSLVDYQLIKAGHFYVDQGACQMIIDGRILIRRCEQGVREFCSDGIILADGTKVESDVVVLATGFEFATKAIERLMPKEVMEKVGDVCGLDENQERIGVWKPTGMPGFWFMTGSFIWSRQFAPILALQIAAIEWGLNSGYQW
ncbi:flavin-binding monooxygenase [Aspergillus granulosus]|uniref:Flavin-binding monooxygenase n=1 Tax=Aspergillus granulosus TaxID=176169 RepID=A0ABR4HZT8_9EURO